MYIYIKTICVEQLGSNLESPYAATLTSPWAAVLMKEEMCYKTSLFLTPDLWLGEAAGSCFHQHSPLTVLSRVWCLVPGQYWELQPLTMKSTGSCSFCCTGISGPFFRVCQWCASSWTSLWDVLEPLFPLASPCLCELQSPCTDAISVIKRCLLIPNFIPPEHLFFPLFCFSKDPDGVPHSILPSSTQPVPLVPLPIPFPIPSEVWQF